MEHLDKRFKKIQPAVVAVFKNHDQLENILEELKAKNFRSEDISILAAKRKDLKKVSHEVDVLDNVETGLLAGVTAGGIFCWLASLSIITLPGAGVFIAAGPFISAIAGIALGANVGALTGVLVGFGVAEVEARRIEKYMKDKGVIIAVHVDDPRTQLEAKRIFVTNGAVEIFNPAEEQTSSLDSSSAMV